MSDSPRFRFGVVSDAHLAPRGTEPYVWQNLVDLPHAAALLEAGLAWLATQEIDTLVLLGDLTESADPACFAAVGQRALALGAPVLAVPGNCDVDPEERTLTAFTQVAAAGLTIAPLLDVNDGVVIELIGLAGGRGAKRLSGVRADAEPGHANLRIVFSHYPVLDLEPDLTEAGFKHSGNLVNRAKVEADLRSAGAPTLVVHGHLHVHEARISGSLLHISCAALIEPPHHVSVVEVISGDRTVTVKRRAHSVRSDGVDRMPVFVPERGCWDWVGHSWEYRG